jgi:5-methylcytosine-specific restriction endonuclease McrA
MGRRATCFPSSNPRRAERSGRNQKGARPDETLIDVGLTRLVWQRANYCCEYCQLPQEYDDRPFEIDRIVSRKHRGPSVASNLALSCFRCNAFQGTDISGRDRVTRKLTRLFDPRRHKWMRHFRWEGPYLVGRMPIGRVTIEVLNITDLLRVELREELIEEGLFPPA